MKKYLNNFYEVQKATYQLLTDNLQEIAFKKREDIIVPGQIQKKLFFVKSGIQMSFFDGKDKRHVMAFTYPPNICAIPNSFALQQPSQHFLTCLSDSSFYYISYDKLSELFYKSQELERLFRKMTEAVLSGLIKRHIELHSLTIEERYKVFCQRSPQLLHQVPHKYIASYLGMNPTNFSKLYNNVTF